MARRLTTVLVVVALLGGACGSDEGDDPASGSGSGTDGPVTLPVSVDAMPDDFSASFFSYFPRQVSARPGDTVEFTSDFSGEPHTVAFGTLIDATELDADPQPSAAQPCFVVSGVPPATEACPAGGQPDFDGTQPFFSSGFLPDEATFSVRLAENIAPGTYQFMCLVDRTEMTGQLTVVGSDEAVPSPADVSALAQRDIDAAVAALQPRADRIRAITAPPALAGAPEEDGAAPPVTSTVNVFPDEVSVPVGGAVTWSVDGAHTIAFGSPEDARPLYAFDGEGVVRANKKGANPAGGAGMPSGASPPLLVDGGAYEEGFRNSGLLVGSGDVQYKLTFPTAGTYQYRCLFHTDMEGTVKVG